MAYNQKDIEFGVGTGMNKSVPNMNKVREQLKNNPKTSWRGYAVGDPRRAELVGPGQGYLDSLAIQRQNVQSANIPTVNTTGLKTSPNYTPPSGTDKAIMQAEEIKGSALTSRQSTRIRKGGEKAARQLKRLQNQAERRAKKIARRGY